METMQTQFKCRIYVGATLEQLKDISEWHWMLNLAGWVVSMKKEF